MNDIDPQGAETGIVIRVHCLGDPGGVHHVSVDSFGPRTMSRGEAVRLLNASIDLIEGGAGEFGGEKKR